MRMRGSSLEPLVYTPQLEYQVESDLFFRRGRAAHCLGGMDHAFNGNSLHPCSTWKSTESHDKAPFSRIFGAPKPPKSSSEPLVWHSNQTPDKSNYLTLFPSPYVCTSALLSVSAIPASWKVLSSHLRRKRCGRQTYIIWVQIPGLHFLAGQPLTRCLILGTSVYSPAEEG